MPGFLQRLRAKPPQTRKRIALGTSVTVTSLVFVMWVTVLNYGFVGSEGEMQDINTNTTQVASPLSAFSDNASTAFQQLQERFSTPTTSDNFADGSTSTVENNQSVTANRNDSYQSDSGSDMYWVNHQQSQSESTNTQTEGSAANSQSAAANNSTETEASNKEPFNSRNYNPIQESEWFSQ